MKKNIIIVILSIIIVIMGIGYVILLSDSKTNNNIENKLEEKNNISKDEYYKKMLIKLNAYYNIYYRNLKGADLGKKIQTPLNNLKLFGFPIDEFVSYDKKKPCDIEKTYATRDEKRAIKIYYVCGEDANYRINTTTKKTS